MTGFAEIRPDYLIPTGYGRTVYRPGELAQWDLWEPACDIPVGFGQTARLPVIVGVSGFSRWIVARMIASAQTHDVLGGHRWCLQQLGRVPGWGVYDGEHAISSRRGGRVYLTDALLAFMARWGWARSCSRRGIPNAKTLVERVNGYLEMSLLPGRTFSGVDDFNIQLGDLARASCEPAGARGVAVPALAAHRRERT